MTYAGVMFVLGTILFTGASSGQILLVLAGLVMVQLGVWRVAGSMMPSTRTNQVLRDSVIEFLASVKELYRLANDQQRAMFDATAENLRGQADSIIEAARRDLTSETT
jgi:hypothetical protein